MRAHTHKAVKRQTDRQTATLAGRFNNKELNKQNCHPSPSHTHTHIERRTHIARAHARVRAHTQGVYNCPMLSAVHHLPLHSLPFFHPLSLSLSAISPLSSTQAQMSRCIISAGWLPCSVCMCVFVCVRMQVCVCMCVFLLPYSLENKTVMFFL